jgi:hypothetical protein
MSSSTPVPVESNYVKWEKLERGRCVDCEKVIVKKFLTDDSRCISCTIAVFVKLSQTKGRGADMHSLGKILDS